MKKKVLIIFILSLFMISIVNAGFLDIFTGKQIAYDSDRTSYFGSYLCRDFDGGKNPEIFGTITYYERSSYFSFSRYQKVTKEDICTSEGSVLEYYCDGRQGAGEEIICEFGCENGACKEGPQIVLNPGSTCEDKCGDGVCQRTTTAMVGSTCPESAKSCPEDCEELIECVDSDGGLDYYKKGVTKGKNYEGTYLEKEDFCYDGIYNEVPQEKGPSIAEFYCSNNTLRFDHNYKCPIGCKDGACIKELIKLEVPPKEPTCGGVISNDVYQIKKAGDEWNLNEQASEIDSQITDNELELLADQTFNDDEGTNIGEHDYSQTIDFGGIPDSDIKTLVWKFDRDTSGDRLGDPSNDYLYLSSNTYAWNYTLKITGSPIDVKNRDDIINTKLEILRNIYTIIDAHIPSDYGDVQGITLLGGDIIATLVQNNPFKGITVLDVDDAETKCIVKYDNVTYQIDKGQIKTMSDGTVIGITDVVSAVTVDNDICEIAIGAKKIEINDGRKVRVNNEEIDGTEAFIYGTEEGNTQPSITSPGLKMITISYTPRDNMWLAPGFYVKDPVFNSYYIKFDKVNQEPKSEIYIDIVSDKVYLKMENKEGDLLDNEVICFLNQNDKITYGKDRKHLMAVNNGDELYAGEVGSNDTIFKNMAGTRFVMTFDDISHLVEITEINEYENQTSFKIIDTGEVYSDIQYINRAVTSFYDINNNLKLTFDDINKKIIFDNINDEESGFSKPTYVGKYNKRLLFDHNCNLQFIEGQIGTIPEVDLTSFQIEFKYDSVDDEIEFKNSDSRVLGDNIRMEQLNDNSFYTYVGRTDYGTFAQIYTKDDGDLKITSLQNPATADVYIKGCPKLQEVIITTTEEVNITASEENITQTTTEKTNITQGGDTSETITEIEYMKRECNGCVYNKKCLNVGTKLGRRYCSLSGEMYTQKGEGSYCINNFECQSNLCVDGECVSSGAWRKFLAWFRNIFG